MVTHTLPFGMPVRIEAYVRDDGSSPFKSWFDRLDHQAAAKGPQASRD